MAKPAIHDTERDVRGNAKAGATVALYDQTSGALISCFTLADDGAPAANPITCDSLGRWGVRLDQPRTIRKVVTYRGVQETVEHIETAGGTAVASADQAALVDNTGGDVSDSTLAEVPTTQVGHVHWSAPDATSNSGSADQLDLSAATGGETMANIVQPDYPRSVRLQITDGDNSINSWTIDVVGTDIRGAAQSESFSQADGFGMESDKIFATITSVTVTAIDGSGAGDTLDMGYGIKLGVPVPAGTDDLTVVRLNADGADEAAAAVDQTNNSVTPTTAPNASVNFDLQFRYTDPAIEAARDGLAKAAELANALRSALVTQSIITGAA